MSRLGVLAVCAIAACAGCSVGAVGSVSPTTSAGVVESNATVTKVIDGDTIDVVVDGHDDRVRLIGIDTPEIAHPAMGERPANHADCYGDEAARYTQSLLTNGTPVRLERDVVARDDYGRMLAYVYRAGDGIFVNYEIVRHGYARPLSIAPNTSFAELLLEATRQAERADAGLWSACRGG